MNKLAPGKFAEARAYLLGHARALDQALFLYYFEDGPATAVWQALAAYQNGDGGFGHALEPDLRTPSSSALGTGIALRLLEKTGALAEHSLVLEAVDYLQSTLDPQALTWRVAPLDANDYAHAPWWHDENGSLAKTFDDYQIIPRAELVAMLLHFTDQGASPWLGPVVQAAVTAVERLPIGSGGGDDLVYALRLAQSMGLPAAQREKVLQRVREVTPAAVTREPAKWESYSIPPLKLAPTPESPVADLLHADIDRNLDFVITKQSAGGYWEPNWTWGDFFPEDWPAARDEWRGEITLHNLLSLRDYGRLA